MLCLQSLRDTLKEIIPAKQEQLKKLVRFRKRRAIPSISDHAINCRKPNMATLPLVK